MKRDIIGDWPEVSVFADSMRRRLEENKEKGGWEDCCDQYLVAKLAEEVAELVLAMRDGNPPDKVLHEAADVANIAMMIADNWSIGEDE